MKLKQHFALALLLSTSITVGIGARSQTAYAATVASATVASGADAARCTPSETPLHRAVSIAAYAYLAILLEELVSYMTLRAIGFDQLRYSWDLKPLPGLHYLIEDPQKNDVAFVVLQQLNLFTIAYGFLLAYGTRRIFGISWLGAVSTAILAILAKVGIAALVAALKP